MAREFDIEHLATDLEHVSNLIVCFDEFCSSEKDISDFEDITEKGWAAINFIRRMEQRLSMINVAEEILIRDLKELNAYIGSPKARAKL